MTAAPAIALFLCDHPKAIDLRVASHIWLARKVGFRPIIAPWRGVRETGQELSVRDGFEVTPELRKRALAPVAIRPSVVIHRSIVAGARQVLVRRIARAHPRAQVSFAAPWTTISRKGPSELAFRDGESFGVRVARPPTLLVRDAELDALADFGRRVPLIFKPSGGSQCFGIRISTPATFDDVLAEVRARPGPFVAQELLTDPLLYDGHKADLRLYALVSSFAPLRFRVYRGGVVRLAAQPFAGAPCDEGLAALTGCSYRKRQHAPIHNATVEQWLQQLRGQGLIVDDFWERVDRLMHDVFTCLGRAPAVAALPEGALDKRFYLTGFDVILRRDGRNVQPLFIETNYVPQLNGWGPAVDRRLRVVHGEWVADLAQMAS
jgi:hypothetical protein